jgi:lipid A 3-O-deacylase
MALKSSWILLSSILLILLSAPPALADDPALIGFSVGVYDQDWVEPNFLFLEAGHGGNDKAVDFRLEYRSGTSLVPWTEPYVKIKPFAGLEATSDLALYGLGGILFDIPLGPVMITPSFGAGLYSRGQGRDLGFPVEFRSQLEVGYRFENEMRVSVAYSHISNANLSETNPGVDMISAYLHVPVKLLMGN